MLEKSDESTNISWIRISELKKLLEKNEVMLIILRELIEHQQQFAIY